MAWSEVAQEAFDKLKQAFINATCLDVPNFEKLFIVKTDASSTGIGAVLMQERKPLAYLCKTLGPKLRRLSVHKKELLAIVHVVQKWEQYLSSTHFLIKTDQKKSQMVIRTESVNSFSKFLVI